MRPVTTPSTGSSHPRVGQAVAQPEGGADVVAAALDRGRLALGARAAVGLEGQLGEPRAAARRAARGCQQAAVHQQVGVAPDRRGEVEVRRAGEPGVPDLRRRVVRLAQRAQHQRPQRLAAAPARAPGGGRPPRAAAAAAARRAGRAELALRQRRRRHAELVELRRRASRCGSGRGPRGGGRPSAGRGRSGGARRPRSRRSCTPRPGSAPASGPRGGSPRRGRPSKRTTGSAEAASSAPRPIRRAAQDGGDERGQLGHVALEGRVAERPAVEGRVHLAVGQAPLRADQRAREARLPHLAVAVDDHLDRDRRPVDAGAQAAEVGRQARGQHRVDRPGHVDRAAAPRRLAVEGAARRRTNRATSAMWTHRRHAPPALGGDGQGVVVVLGALGVDRDDALVAQVAAAAGRRRRRPRRGRRPPRTAARGKGRAQVLGRQQRRAAPPAARTPARARRPPARRGRACSP